MTCYTALIVDWDTGRHYQLAAHNLITGPSLTAIVRRRFGQRCTISDVRTWPDELSLERALVEAFNVPTFQRSNV